MGDTRISHGFAIGRYANFYSRTDNLFAESDATPDVTNGVLFYASNTSVTTITHFDLSATSTAATASQGFEGKRIALFTLTTNTTIANNGGNIVLSTTDGSLRSNTFIEFVYHNSSWYETNRSSNQTNTVKSLTIGGGSAGVAVDDTELILVSGQSATNSLSSLSGGYIGQIVTLVREGSNTVQIHGVVGDGNIYVASTNNFVMNASSAYQLVKAGADNWRFLEVSQ